MNQVLRSVLIYCLVVALLSVTTTHATTGLSRVATLPHSTTDGNHNGLFNAAWKTRMLNSVLTKIHSYRGGASDGAGNSVMEISTLDEFEGIISAEANKGKVIVVDFSASWCMPCKAIAPVYKQMAESNEFNGAIFLKVDVDDVSAVARKYDVMSMPTFLFLRDGQVVERFSGASVQKLTDTLQGLLQQ